jgi:protein-S-isoprenylcysteine O-methyltransferase Ste14
VYPFIIAKRIRHEEEFLVQELPGYEAYRKKVKYRMIPLVW